MIDPRRAALLGLTVPLTPIVIALLGLWPVDEEEPLPVYVVPVSEGGGGRRVPQRPKMQRASRAFLAEQQRIVDQNRAAIAMIVAIAETECL